jgi:hypothetical protein
MDSCGTGFAGTIVRELLFGRVLLEHFLHGFLGLFFVAFFGVRYAVHGGLPAPDEMLLGHVV